MAGNRDGITLRLKATGEGREVYYARYQVPWRQKGGKIEWRRVERSTRVCDPKEARAVAQKMRAAEVAAAFEEQEAPAGKTFAQAALAYLKAHSSVDRLRAIEPLLPRIGNTPLEAIDSAFVAALAEELKPGCSPATQNRWIYTPIVAVLRSAETREWRPPTITRPKGAHPPTNWKQPPKHWWRAVVDHAPPHLAALILFLRLHGRRIGEAVRIEPRDIDRDGDMWIVHIRDTKVGQRITQQLAAPVVEQLKRYEWWTLPRVFGYTNSRSPYDLLKRVCRDAGVPYHVPKDIGRHEFASSLLRAGKTLKEVQEAGRWASVSMPARTYGHLERRHVDDAARALGEEWFQDQQEKGNKAVPIRKKKHAD